MIGRERRMLLRHYLAQGVSKSALARQLGIATRFTGGFGTAISIGILRSVQDTDNLECPQSHTAICSSKSSFTGKTRLQ